MPTTPTTDPVPSKNPVDFLFNVEVIDRFATSEDETFTDRLGNTRKTVAGLTADVEAAADTATETTIPGIVALVTAAKDNAVNTLIPADVAAVESARATAVGTSIPAQVALVSEAVAATYVGQAGASAAAAQADRVLAETAAQTAFVNANVYASIAAAQADTGLANGAQYQIVSTDGLTMLRYRKDSGSASTGPLSSYPTADLVRKIGTPFVASVSATNAGGSADLYQRLLSGIVDVKLYGLPTTDTYYIERVRRNVGGTWFVTVKRTSDTGTVLQFFAALTEPTDPSSLMRVPLPATGTVLGAFGYLMVRWSDFVAGATNSGLTMTLHPDCLNRDLSSELNCLPASSARVGNVPMTLDPTAFVSVNETTRTVTWPELRICDGYANSFGYFRLGAGSVTFDANLQIAWLDLSELASPAYAGGTTIPASVVKKGTYDYAGKSSTTYAGLSHQWPIAWSSGAGRVDLNPALRQAPTAATTVYNDDMVVKVDQANNIVSVYLRANGSDTASLTYIHYRLFHYVASDADVWTIDGIWEMSRTGYESFSTVKEIQVSSVEILCALQEVGAADFMGGRAHGNEVVTQAPTLLIDGREVSLTSGAASWHHAREITFIQSSKLYRDDSLATPISVELARRKLWLCWKNGEMLADQRIEHLASYSLTAGYLAMLGPHRYEIYSGTENTSSAQISGYYADNVRMIAMDATVRQTGQVPDDYVLGQAVPVTRVKLWGSYGIECEMEVLETSAAILKNLMYVNRTGFAYNKAYIGFISGYSGVQNVTTADKWQIKTRYRISSKN